MEQEIPVIPAGRVDNMADLEDEVDFMRENQISNNSKKIYNYSTINYLKWLYANRQNVLTEEFIGAVEIPRDTGRPTTESIIAFLDTKEPPVHFDQISAKDFMTWLASLRKKNGDKPGFSTYNSHRSAFSNMFRYCGILMPSALEKDLATHFKGLKRLTVQNLVAGNENIKIGKDPLSFELYKFLAKQMLMQPTPEYIFAHTFMLLTWNLMCR
jgi:hypothetical protein